MYLNKFCYGVAAVFTGLFHFIEPFIMFKFRVFMRHQGSLYAPKDPWAKSIITDPLYKQPKRTKYGNYE